MGKWTVRDGVAELFIVESHADGTVSIHIPSPDPVIFSRAQAERIRMFVGAAIGSAPVMDRSSMNVTWMKMPRSIDTHGFTERELSIGLEQVQSVGLDGPYPIADLVEDELAGRCAACVRAAVKLARP